MARKVTKAAGAVGALLVGGAVLGACGNAPGRPLTTLSVKADPKCQSGMPTVTVQGFGSAQGAPDQAIISLGVQTQAKTAAAAMQSNSTKANAVVKLLEADGVAKADLQTSGLSVQPNYNNNGTVILNYQVTNNVTVTVNDVSQSGAIIDDVAQVAGNAVRVDGISFAVRNQTNLMGQARTAAVEQASGQARLMATAAGMALGPLCSLQDNSSPVQPQPVYAGDTWASAAKSAATPIEAGSQQVTANVTAVYQLDTTASATEGTQTGA